MGREYKEPKTQFIRRSNETERLYQLEEKVIQIIETIGKEYSKYKNIHNNDFWTEAMPQVLFDILSSFDTACSVEAAMAFLREKENREN